MKARNARRFTMAAASLALTAALAGYGVTKAAQADSDVVKLSQPIPGLSCGWQGNPCKLDEIIVTASKKG